MKSFFYSCTERISKIYESKCIQGNVLAIGKYFVGDMKAVPRCYIDYNK